MNPARAACLTLLLCAGLGVARATDGRSAAVDVAGIENCISEDWLHFGGQDHSAVLDEADHRRVRAEMLRRYPVIAADALPSSRTILWHKASGELLYVAVVDNPARPGQACFSATFAAGKFDLSTVLRRKYLPADDAAK